jgi:hypothetical protein
MVFWIRTLGACSDVSVERADSISRATEFGSGGYWTNMTQFLPDTNLATLKTEGVFSFETP